MNRTTFPRLAVVFQRIGPYHDARLRAAARTSDCVAVQACALDNTYEWSQITHRGEYSLSTLFKSEDCEDLSASILTRNLFRVLTTLNPDAVMIPGWSSKLALCCLQWCILNEKAAVMASDSTAWDFKRQPLKEWIKKRIVSACSAGLVAGRPHVDYLADLGMPRERIFLGYDVVDNDYFRRQAAEVKNSGLQLRQGLPQKYFLASARFVEKKNLPRLLEAYGCYRKLVSTTKSGNEKAEIWNLVLLGDGPLRKDLENRIVELGLQNSVMMPGFKQYDELPTYYGLADAFVHASTTEQWGLVVNEAMAAGLPVLVSNRCGCAQDLVHEGKNGFTFNPWDICGLAQYMLGLSHGESNLQKMGKASLEIISHWGVEKFADGLNQAVHCALRYPISQPQAIVRLLLKLLMSRRGE